MLFCKIHDQTILKSSQAFLLRKRVNYLRLIHEVKLKNRMND